MRPPHPLPSNLVDRPFAVRQAVDQGVHPERLRRADLVAPFVGTRLPADREPTLLDLCRALAEVRPDCFISHATAARLHGLPLPARFRGDTAIDLAVFNPGRSPRLDGVRGHHLDRRYTSVVQVKDHAGSGDHDGVPTSSPVSTWRQLAWVLSERELVAVGDSLLRRQQPMATIDQLQAAVDSLRGVPGHGRLYRALLDVRPGTDSGQESSLRVDLIQAGLPEPEINPAIYDADGEFIGYGDMVFREQKVIVEYDGDHHRTDIGQYNTDVDRLNAFGRAGWLVIRVNKSHRGAARARIVAEIRDALIDRGWRPALRHAA
ncbi:DUF559 domain-containing protein [Ruania alba]|uniref:DUF559 domain-containing protein n=1 Tax=Ruania alba TaxID=648782 RepID=A0A1H5N5L3_9MICO|nr:DUF559 domain-containing protein [Ruania alba]SEE95958.1 Protein of unknown function [Ruania alba]